MNNLFSPCIFVIIKCIFSGERGVGYKVEILLDIFELIHFSKIFDTIGYPQPLKYTAGCVAY